MAKKSAAKSVKAEVTEKVDDIITEATNKGGPLEEVDFGDGDHFHETALEDIDDDIPDDTEDEEVEEEEDIEIELSDDKPEETDEEEAEEVTDLTDETFDKALEAGVPYNDIKDKTEAEVLELIPAPQTDTPVAEKPEEDEDTTPSKDDAAYKLDADVWPEDVIKTFQPVLDGLKKSTERIEQLENRLEQQDQQAFANQFTSDLDDRCNSLESGEFGSGTYNKGLSKSQKRARAALGRGVGTLLAKGVDMDDAFELAVKRHSSDAPSASKKADKKAAQKARATTSGSRGKTKEPGKTFKQRIEDAGDAEKEFMEAAGVVDD